MQTFKCGIALALVISLSSPLEAGFRRFRGARQPRMVMGEEAARKVEHLLTSLNWQTSLETALKQAASQNKLVFWVHMLGRMDGST